MRPLALFLYLSALIGIASPMGFTQPIPTIYGLRPGLELICTATLELTVDGAYSEQSTRVIESRLVVLDEAKSGWWPVLGLSRLSQRILEGQELGVPFKQFQAYRFRVTAQGEFGGYEGEKAEFGTGWTPMIHFPPLPKDSVQPESRVESVLPIDVGLERTGQGKYSILMRSSANTRDQFILGAGLLQPVSIQQDPAVSVLYQEYETRYDRRTCLSPFSRTSTQMQMDTPQGVFHIDLTVENQLQPPNVFPAEDVPAIRAEVTNFFNYKEDLLSGNESVAEENLKYLTAFSNNSPLRFMRDAAKDLIAKYRYDKQFEENRKKADLASQAPAFSGISLQGEPVRFPPEKRKAVVLLFWALWWEPSERALWDMEEIRKSLARRNIQFIGINLDSVEKIPKRYLEPTGIQMPTVWDKEYPQAGIAFEYGVHTIPAIIVIDKNGKIVGRDLQPDELNEALDKVSR